MSILLIGALVGLGSVARAADKPTHLLDPVVLEVALVTDPDFPALDDALISRALEAARRSYSEKFDVAAPEFRIKAKYRATDFVSKYARVDDLRCARLFGARYLGGGKSELRQYRDKAIEFFQKWDLESLRGFVAESEREKIKSYEDMYDIYETRYVATIEKIKSLETPKGTELASPDRSRERSYVAWTCALSLQEDYDVILTNTFIMADLLSEPHPHAVFGKARIGGIAGPSPARRALGGQALLASTFGIDTKIKMLSELEGRPATLGERARILGSYLLAHEIAHAVIGIPDVFDHPPGCLMTSRPGMTYREGLRELDEHHGPCPACRPWVEARAFLDQGRVALDRGEFKDALGLLGKAAAKTPKHMAGGYKRRMSEISILVARSYEGQGNLRQAKKFARTAQRLDPRSLEAKELVRSLDKRDVSVASAERELPLSRTGTATDDGTRASSN